MWFFVYFLNRLFCSPLIFCVLVKSFRSIFNYYLLFTLFEMFLCLGWKQSNIHFTTIRMKNSISNSFRESLFIRFSLQRFKTQTLNYNIFVHHIDICKKYIALGVQDQTYILMLHKHFRWEILLVLKATSIN